MSDFPSVTSLWSGTGLMDLGQMLRWGVPHPFRDAFAAGYGALPMGPAACQGCHTEDNSPDFEWAGYWAEIAHGR